MAPASPALAWRTAEAAHSGFTTRAGAHLAPPVQRTAEEDQLRRSETHAAAHRAVAAAALEFSNMGWAFREQSPLDFGIDALAEEVDDGFLTGRLIALVFKAGRTFFSEPDGDGWLYGGRNEELSYWLSYSLPVVLLAQHPDTGLTYWQHFTPDAVTYTSRGWKIRIPARHVLSPDARQALTAIAGGRRTSRYWVAAARAAARAEATTATPVGQPPQEDFVHWVGTLVDRFQDAVENTDTWRVLWDDKLKKPRGELIVHATAATMWTWLCELADVDMTRESDAGRGAVDFKFSSGWHRRALLEVKLLSSSKLFQGANVQLPQYLASERISCAYYVCLGFTDRDLRPERLAFVRATCAAYEARSGSVVIPRFIDARPKLSASRLSTSVKPRGNR
jgi:hypothetical protein